MQQNLANDTQSTACQLRPVVITVIAAKMAVFALLMTTVNISAPGPFAVELAQIR